MHLEQLLHLIVKHKYHNINDVIHSKMMQFSTISIKLCKYDIHYLMDHIDTLIKMVDNCDLLHYLFKHRAPDDIIIHISMSTGLLPMIS